MIDLPTVWFVILAFLWFGYLLLECFDMGVGVHMFITAKSPTQRRVLLNTIGPVWDGNEVWLVTAVAATFAAFPDWYASLLSSLYLPIFTLLVALIIRAISIEYRSKFHASYWIRAWDVGMAAGSLVASFAVGMMLAVTTTGLPIDDDGNRVGGPFAWFTLPGVLGGVAIVCFSLAHGATFLALKADGPVRVRARAFAARWSALALLPLASWILVVQWQTGDALSWSLAAAAVPAFLVYQWAVHTARERAAFAGVAAFLAFGVAAIFTASYPVVLPSTIEAAFNLDVWNASSSEYTLGVMSVIALAGVPAVMVTQGWSYWIFRRRLAERNIPHLHEVPAALARPAVSGQEAP